MVQETKIIHTQFLKSNYLHSDADLSNFYLRCYGKALSFDYAHNVLDEMCERDISSWNLIIGCWNRSLKYADMWGMFCKLRLLGFYPNEFTYGSVLSACVGFSFVNCGNVVCWNAVKHNEDDVGLNHFRQMCSGNPLPNRFTFPSVFGACAKREKLELRKGVHGLVVEYGE
ncbi:pentatricopeptide repeat-containing protein [Tanacetum coccineum]